MGKKVMSPKETKLFETKLALARMGKPAELDVLVHDKSALIRMAVLNHGTPYHWNILADDKDKNIRTAARQKLKAVEEKINQKLIERRETPF